MSSKSDYRGYVSLAAIVARLGGGAEGKLADAHIAGRLHLAGHRRDRSGVADEEEIIPPHALKGWKPGGKGAVRFNLKTNSIEANASIGRRTRKNSTPTAKQARELQAAFTVFESRALYGWEDVGAPAHEVDALVEFLRAAEPIEKAGKADTPAVPRGRGRPKGSGGFQHADEQLFREADKIRQGDPDKSLSKIADELLPKLKGNSDDSKKKRFVSRYGAYLSKKAAFL